MWRYFKRLCSLAMFGSLVALASPVNAQQAEDAPPLETQCEEGLGDACLESGALFEEQETDTAQLRARELYRKGCDLGENHACHRLVNMMLNGRGGEQDLSGALAIAAALCIENDGQGCSDQAKSLIIMANGQPFDQADLQELFSLYEKGCDLGFAEACGQLGALVSTGVAGEADPQKGYELLKTGCLGDSYMACYNLAIVERDGLAHAASETDAKAYFEKACDGGIASSCNDLAIMFMQASDRQDNDQWRAQAFGAFVKACDLGEPSGCSNGARQMYQGRGVERDIAQAYSLAVRGCESSSANGCHLAASIQRAGEGIDTDRTTMLGLLRKACELNHPTACDELNAGN